MLPTSILLLVLTISAPVPPAKAPKPPAASSSNLAGGWRLHWGSGQGDCVLTPDPGGKTGTWWCTWASQPWIGSWRLEGDILHITEGRMPSSPDGTPDSPIVWRVRLDKTGLTGECEHEGRRFAFRLERAEQLKAPKAEQP